MNAVLMDAVAAGHANIVKGLVRLGIDTSAALMSASFNGHIDVVKALIAAGADVNAMNGDGRKA